MRFLQETIKFLFIAYCVHAIAAIAERHLYHCFAIHSLDTRWYFTFGHVDYRVWRANSFIKIRIINLAYNFVRKSQHLILKFNEFILSNDIFNLK